MPTAKEILLDFMGPAAKELGTGPDSILRRLGPANFELGIIAGDRPGSPLMSKKLKGPNDGTVTVVSTKLRGMKDHVTVHVGHTFMMNHPLVIEQVLTFLKRGRFQPGLTETEAEQMLQKWQRKSAAGLRPPKQSTLPWHELLYGTVTSDRSPALTVAVASFFDPSSPISATMT